MNWPFLRWVTSHGPIFSIVWISLLVLVLAEDEDPDRAQPTTTLRDGRCFPKDTCKSPRVISQSFRYPFTALNVDIYFLQESRSVSLDWKKWNCMCDELCIQYGDCCLDSPHYADDQWRKAEKRFTCVEFSPSNSYWIINTCPISWTDEATRSLCEKNLNIGKLDRDFTSHLPVTSIINRVTYRNIHCARCNGESKFAPDGSVLLRSWKPRLVCPSPLANFIMSPDSKVQF
jgi:hypothetical protein